MTNWNDVSTLELVEAYAEGQNMYFKLNWIDSEEVLSQMFDEGHADWLHEHRDDHIMISECFNNWTDGLCKDGVIHPEQYDKYGYVGKYSE